MGFFDTIYIVTEEKLDTSLLRKQWFWDKSEAEQFYHNQLHIEERIITLYAFDLRETIDEKIDSLMANRHSHVTPSPLQEIQSTRPAPEEREEWTELVFRPDGCFTFERIVSPDYWPYIVEPYAGELARGTQSWRVLDGTTATPLAIIRPKEVGTNTAFSVVVNGYSKHQAFNDLKSAAVYAVTQHNG